jgi:hypothetical protein
MKFNQLQRQNSRNEVRSANRSNRDVLSAQFGVQRGALDSQQAGQFRNGDGRVLALLKPADGVGIEIWLPEVEGIHNHKLLTKGV